jgi:hypothetical protein
MTREERAAYNKAYYEERKDELRAKHKEHMRLIRAAQRLKGSPAPPEHRVAQAGSKMALIQEEYELLADNYGPAVALRKLRNKFENNDIEAFQRAFKIASY